MGNITVITMTFFAGCYFGYGHWPNRESLPSWCDNNDFCWTCDDNICYKLPNTCCTKQTCNRHSGHASTCSACGSILTHAFSTLINVIFAVDSSEATQTYAAVANASHDVMTEPSVLTWRRHAVVHVHLTVISKEAFGTCAPVAQHAG